MAEAGTSRVSSISSNPDLSSTVSSISATSSADGPPNPTRGVSPRLGSTRDCTDVPLLLGSNIGTTTTAIFAVIGASALVAAGAVVREGFEVPEGTLAAGVPAVVKRPLTPEEAAVCPAFKAWVEKQVEEMNRGLARYEQIKKFALLPNELTTDADELTPTMKLKRRVIQQKYGQTIDSLYA